MGDIERYGAWHAVLRYRKHWSKEGSKESGTVERLKEEQSPSRHGHILQEMGEAGFLCAAGNPIASSYPSTGAWPLVLFMLVWSMHLAPFRSVRFGFCSPFQKRIPICESTPK